MSSKLPWRAVPAVGSDALALLQAMLDGTEAWAMLSALGEAATVPLAELLNHAPPLVELWSRPDGVAAVLTPWALWATSATVTERLAFASQEIRVWDGPSRLPARRVVRVCFEVPISGDDTDEDTRPIRSPRHAMEVELPHPELVVDRRGPDVVLDEADDEPLVLMGQVVRRDRRIKGKPLAGRVKRRAG